jgi:hypothetical protein
MLKCALPRKNVDVDKINISRVIPINNAGSANVNLKADRHHKLAIKQKNVMGR